MTSELPVTQADRDAAAAYMKLICDHRWSWQAILDGGCDNTSVVLAFAAHRIAAISALEQPTPDMRERVAKAILDAVQVGCDMNPAEALIAADAALAALKDSIGNTDVTVTDEMVDRARECAKEHTDEDIDWREILTAALKDNEHE